MPISAIERALFGAVTRLPFLVAALLTLGSVTACTTEENSGAALALPASYGSVMDRAADNGLNGVLIATDDRTALLERGYGLADREERRPYTPATIHDIGSLTKTFTAAAIAKLVLDGRIDLAAPVKRYLPAAAEPAAKVTIQQLLTHRSGMVEYCGDEKDDATKSAMLKRCMAAPLRFEPGSDWAYSNPGYSVLGMIVESVSGDSLDQYLKREFFAPLRMSSTGYAVPGAERAALGYLKGRRHVPFSGPEVLNGHHWNIAGNGGMVSSASDMKRWFEAMSKPNRVVSEPLRQMLTTPLVQSSEKLAYGFAWTFVLDENKCVISMSHAGSDGVMYSYFYWHQPLGNFFYLHANNGEAEIVPVVRELRSVAGARRHHPHTAGVNECLRSGQRFVA